MLENGLCDDSSSWMPKTWWVERTVLCSALLCHQHHYSVGIIKIGSLQLTVHFPLSDYSPETCILMSKFLSIFLQQQRVSHNNEALSSTMLLIHQVATISDMFWLHSTQVFWLQKWMVGQTSRCVCKKSPGATWSAGISRICSVLLHPETSFETK